MIKGDQPRIDQGTQDGNGPCGVAPRVGHSIGMTMIEFPKVGEGNEQVLRENMILSLHPHAIAANGEDCVYMQDAWLVTKTGGVPLAGLPMGFWER